MKPTNVTNINVFPKRAKRNLKNGEHRYHLPKDSLSPRETEVCKLLAKGLQVKEAALQLKISINTVNSHVRNAYQKLGMHRRFALVKHFAEPNVIAVREILTNSIPGFP
jgi:DNA-binding NarL/FixJ family response regulator